MIPKGTIFYLYRHISHVTLMPFYIGIGKKLRPLPRKYATEYVRAHLKHGRTNEWNEIANKGYDIDILFECDSESVIKSKEIEFISLYGRIDLGTGPLVNMSNGGDYFPTGSTENALKSLASAKRNGTHEKRVKILKENLPKRRKTFKKIFIYDSNDSFVKECKSFIECSNFIKCSKSYVSICANKGMACKGYKLSLVYQGENMISGALITGKLKMHRPICQVDPITYKVIKTFPSITSAANELNISKGNFSVAVKNKTKLREYFWKYDDGLSFIPIKKRYRKLRL